MVTNLMTRASRLPLPL